MLHIAPLLLLSLVAPQDDGAASRPVDVGRSAMLEQVRAAVTALSSAAAKGPKTTRGFSAEYKGSMLVEGHYRTPGLRRRIPFRVAIDAGGPETLAVRTTTGNGPAASTETTLFDHGGVAR